MVLTKLLEFIKQLCDKQYTGQLRLNFHEGNLSEKVEKKEAIKLERSFDEEFDNTFWPKNTSPPPQAKGEG